MTFEVEGGTIRLDRATFQRLVDGTDAPDLDGLPRSVAGLDEALAAVREPVAVATVDVASRNVRQRHHLWVAPDTAAMLLHVTGEVHQLMPLPPSLVPAGLARVVRIGPRKVSEREARVVDVEAVSDLFADDDLLRQSAFDTLPGDMAWNLGVSWAGSAAAPQGGDRWLGVLDGREGAWLVTGDEQRTVLEPTRATAIWRRLSTLP